MISASDTRRLCFLPVIGTVRVVPHAASSATTIVVNRNFAVFIFILTTVYFFFPFCKKRAKTCEQFLILTDFSIPKLIRDGHPPRIRSHPSAPRGRCRSDYPPYGKPHPRPYRSFVHRSACVAHRRSYDLPPPMSRE